MPHGASDSVQTLFQHLLTDENLLWSFTLILTGLIRGETANYSARADPDMLQENRLIKHVLFLQHNISRLTTLVSRLNAHITKQQTELNANKIDEK